MIFCESYGILCSVEDVKDVLAYWDINGDEKVDIKDFSESILSRRVTPLKKIVSIRQGDLTPEEARY